MKRRKAKLIIEPEAKKEPPPFAVKQTVHPVVVTAPREELSVIYLPANAAELEEKRKPFLPANPEEVKKELPFKVTSEPLPPPKADVYPIPKFKLSVPESEFVNRDAPQSEEAKDKHIFLTNHIATYGKVSAAEAEAAYEDFRQRKTTATLLAKNPEMRIKQAQKASELPNWLHILILTACFSLFVYLRTQSWY